MRAWTAKDNINWLRDFLPEDIPAARVFSYGYESNVISSQHLCRNVLSLRSKKLLECLHTARKDSQTDRRPLIFIAHSLGGLLLKSALVESAWAAYEQDTVLLEIYQSTAGIVFLGTPHQGDGDVSWQTLLQRLVSFCVKPEKKLEMHKRDTDWLSLSLEQFKSISDSGSNYYCYETKPSIFQDLSSLV